MCLIPSFGHVPTSGLLSVVLVRYGQLFAALCTARSQDATAILSGHALAETMLVYAATIVRLKCSFHCFILNLFIVIRHFGLQNYIFLLNYASFS